MELLDSLSSNRQASTVAELSLNPLFRRDYNSLYKGIQEFLPSPTNDNYQKAVDSLLSVVSATIPPPVSRQFYLFGAHIPHPQLSHKLSPARDLSKNTYLVKVFSVAVRGSLRPLIMKK
ncbi:hypothetical protein MAE_04960 [Microcystis aeruginosa NIES-843]|uniref:Uncharacterized protein n=1 Tax=Microcystis aeruginosa (strain NIES-843 / IAM M-2473) TaxID=449447 RepID=B0JP07_MICAN|nr:hypothetical protein MAE_04960 [Microcystis aeruginosa NIES-843]